MFLPDTVIAEKYLGTPNETSNLLLYAVRLEHCSAAILSILTFTSLQSASPLHHLRHIPSSSLLLVHGMEDKVVDIRHSLKMAKELASAKILFHQQVIYPSYLNTTNSSTLAGLWWGGPPAAWGG
jgi:hypothetical protein